VKRLLMPSVALLWGLQIAFLNTVPTDDSPAGLSTGLYTNTRRIGAIVSGPIIALGSKTAVGNRGIFLACGLLTVLALVVIAMAARLREPRPTADLVR
jgi:hypothetical protein